MTRTDIIRRLRPLRRELVSAAEKVIDEAFGRGKNEVPKKTQFSRLVNLCGEASCAEEIENYLRYQAGRSAGKREAWGPDLVDAVIAGVRGVIDRHELLEQLDGEDQRDVCRVEAWRLYATYLTRRFTYQDAIQPKDKKNAKRRR